MKLKPVTAKEIPVEQTIFNLCWEMLKLYGNIKLKGNDEEWEQLIDDARKIERISKGQGIAIEKLGKDIILGVIDYLETRSKEG